MTPIDLGPHFERLIADEIASGRYASAGEVVRDGLRLVEERRQRLEALDRAIDAGLASGIAEDFSWDDMQARVRTRVADRQS
ncbi:type II toxin-antitoxin system ParD family antitoxin [Marinibaculum pumilum]|uniref:Type II toxin-antitoxin system ParD family antitoxin n=1 Tax=Marinibaculum pumilum TaxID=1766165 RepID=A0ABV7KT91_9PROT